MNEIDVSIIIVSYNSKNFLLQCIDSIYKRLKRCNFEIILIDNDSIDGSQDIVRRRFPGVNLVANKTNVGFAMANNQGLSLARGEFFFLLNPDTEIMSGAIESIISFMNRNPSVGIVGPKLVRSDSTIQSSCKKFPTLRGELLQNIFTDKFIPVFVKSCFGDEIPVSKHEMRVDWVTGACLAIRRKMIEQVGQFDESFFLYYEEVDLCFRAKKRGWDICFFPEAVVVHHGGKSTEKNLRRSLLAAFESKYYFFKKHYKPVDVALSRKFALFGIRIRLAMLNVMRLFSIGNNNISERIDAYENILRVKIKKESYVGIDTSSVYRSRAGVGCYTKNLISELHGMEGRSDFLLFPIREKATKKSTKKKIVLFKIFGGIQRMLWEQIFIPFFLWINGMDIFHSPAYVCPLIKTCPTVVTIHDMAYLLYPEKFVSAYRGYLKFWVPLCISSADKIITDSLCSKKDIVRLLRVPEDKIEVVYLGKSDKFQPIADSSKIASLKERYGLKKDFVLYVGTIEPRKNILGLVKAYRRLKEIHADFDYSLVIGGEKGWKYSDVFDFVKDNSLMNDVIFLGHISEEDLPVLYNSAKVFIYPSLYEGFGLPVLEAMACGVPVITSNTSSLPEIVGDAGIMVDPLDIEALSSAISRVLGDAALRNRMIKSGIKRAAEFSWEKTAQKNMQIYQDLLAEKKR